VRESEGDETVVEFIDAEPPAPSAEPDAFGEGTLDLGPGRAPRHIRRSPQLLGALIALVVLAAVVTSVIALRHGTGGHSHEAAPATPPFPSVTGPHLPIHTWTPVPVSAEDPAACRGSLPCAEVTTLPRALRSALRGYFPDAVVVGADTIVESGRHRVHYRQINLTSPSIGDILVLIEMPPRAVVTARVAPARATRIVLPHSDSATVYISQVRKRIYTVQVQATGPKQAQPSSALLHRIVVDNRMFTLT
jgi:hypothetical protein